jgi:hypothetical protein
MKRGVAIVLLALSCWVYSPGVADASLAGALAGKAASKLDDALKAVKNVWGNGAKHVDDAGKVLGHCGDDLARLAGKYGDDVSKLTSRNRQRLLHLEGQVDEVPLRQAARQGDEAVEQLYKRVTGVKSTPKSVLGRTWDTVKRIPGAVAASLAAFLGGFGLGFFTDLLGDLPAVVRWILKIGFYGFLVLLAFRTLQWLVAILWLTLGPLFRFLRGPKREKRLRESEPAKLSSASRADQPRTFLVNYPEKRPSQKILILAILVAVLNGFVLASGFSRILWQSSAAPAVLEKTFATVVKESGNVPEMTLEERFKAAKAELEEEWSEQVSGLREEMKGLVAERLEASCRKWVSPERMDAFCDDYFGYWRGWQFNFLHLRDLFKEGSPRFDAKFASMMEEHLLFDLEDDNNALYLEIQDLLSSRREAFAERVRQRLEEEFSEEEIANISENLEFGGLSISPSEFMSLARTAGGIADWMFSDSIAAWILERVLGRIGAEAGLGATAAVAGQGAARAGFVTAGGLAKLGLGLSIGIAIDYAVSKGYRMLTEEEFREDLSAALLEGKNNLIAEWEEGIDSALQ